MEQRYYILRLIAWVFKGFSILAFVGTLVGSCAVLQLPNVSIDMGIGVTIGYNSIGHAVSVFLGGVLGALLLWGHAEMILLHIDIEENTRETAINTRREKNEQPRRRNLWEEP